MNVLKGWTAAIFGLFLLATSAHGEIISRVTLATKDIIYDPVTQKIYASVPGSAGSSGNSITVVDPSTGAVGPATFVGSEPGKLALSDDGKTLYAALDGAAAVRRFDVPTQTAGLQFALGSDSFLGPYYAADLAVLPGHPESVAVSRSYEGVSPDLAGVAVYDNGVQRPKVTPTYAGGNIIQIGASASRLYGYDTGISPPGFYRMSIDASGVSVIDSVHSLIRGGTVDMRYDNGLIYADNGQVIDPEARTPVGTFSGVPSFGALVAPDSTVGRVFFLTGNDTDSTRTLLAFDVHTFLPAGSLVISGVSGKAGSLIRWGRDGLAFRTSSNELFLIRTALVAPLPGGRQRIAVYRPFTSEWVLRGDDGTATVVPFGLFGDQPMPADYQGLGHAQVAVFRPGTHEWLIRTDAGATAGPIQWGGPGDLPVPADYFGIGRAQIAVFRPSTGEWFVRAEDGHASITLFGGPGDLPVPADYLGLRHVQAALLRPRTSEWFIRSDMGPDALVPWGLPGDQPVPADYAGVGHAQVAAYRPSTGEWLLRSDAGTQTRVLLGNPGDIPVPGDYAGTGQAQIAVYRPATQTWYIRDESVVVGPVSWGKPGDVPVPAAFAPRFGG